MIAVVVNLEAAAGRAQDLIGALRENAEDSRKEPGCLKWEFSRHLEEPDRFAIYEVYRDRDALQAHHDSPHFARWSERVRDGMLASKSSGRFEILQAEHESPDSF